MVLKAQTLGKFQELPTRPLECWGKMKEFRRKYFHHNWKAKERGDVLMVGVGTMTMTNAIMAGLGDPGSLAHGLYFARLMRDQEQAIRVHEAADGRGFGRDLCSTLRLALGQQFLGTFLQTPSGTPTKPDFAIEPVMCNAQSKTAKALADSMGIPFLAYDVPLITDPTDKEQADRVVGFLVEEMDDVIRRMEKITGKKYDDEKLIEGVYNEWQTSSYMGKVVLLQQSIPSPLDHRMLESICAAAFIGFPSRRETVELVKEFLAETEQRVKDGISALGIERCRLLHEGQPMYFNIRFYRYPSLYGAVFLGGRNIFGNIGGYTIAPDGSWSPLPTLEEQGITLKDRGDALWHVARLALLHRPETRPHNTMFKIQEHIKIAQDWKVHGVVFHLDLGCKMISAGHMEAHTALHQMGIPTMVYEASSSDPRDFTPSQVFDRIDAFLESLGLTKLAPSLEAIKAEAETPF